MGLLGLGLRASFGSGLLGFRPFQSESPATFNAASYSLHFGNNGLRV